MMKYWIGPPNMPPDRELCRVCFRPVTVMAFLRTGACCERCMDVIRADERGDDA